MGFLGWVPGTAARRTGLSLSRGLPEGGQSSDADGSRALAVGTTIVCDRCALIDSSPVLIGRATCRPARGTSVMTSSGLRIVASVIIALGFAQAASGQVAKRRSPRPRKATVRPPCSRREPWSARPSTSPARETIGPTPSSRRRSGTAWARFARPCKSAGLDMQHVVKSFVYLEDPDKYAEMNKYYGEFFPDDPPARTTLGVAQVPGPSRLEITCIAYSDLAETESHRHAPRGIPVQPRGPGGRHALRFGQGRSACRTAAIPRRSRSRSARR